MREDLDRMLNLAIDRAIDLLARHGEFFPFGGAIDVGGGYLPFAGWTGSEHRPSADVAVLIVQGARGDAAAGKIRAFFLCQDTLCREAKPREHAAAPFDALMIDLESPSECARIIAPYWRDVDSDGIVIGELVREPYTPVVFTTNAR